MKIFDLIISEFIQNVSGNTDFPNYFYEDDMLLEATLLDLLHYTLYSTTALLIDLRTSMYFGEGNTLIIVFRGVREVVLTDNVKRPYVWMIGDSKFTKTAYGVELLLPLIEDTKIKIVAQKVESYIGNAKNIGEVAMSLDDGIDSYLQTTPHWESDFEITAVSKWG